MKKLIVLVMAVAVATSCKRALSREDVEKNLTRAFYKSLTTSRTYDPAKQSFEIKSVNFFDNKAYYSCQFTVHMKLTNGFDTTGIMTANISKDFDDVRRKY